jgi:cytochrome b561
MHIRNKIDHYGFIAIFLHWSMAILILGQIFLGWYMNGLTLSPTKVQLYGIHKQIGIVVLLLATVRLSWRSTNVTPSLSDISLLERVAANSAHRLLYFFMFAVPVSGWLMSSAKGFSVSFFGLFLLPDLISPDKELGHLLKKTHEWLAYGWLGVIALHAVGAFKHHFIDKNLILRRMLF